MQIDGTVSAIVTGGASGLARATVEALAAQGVRVAIFDLNVGAGQSAPSGSLDYIVSLDGPPLSSWRSRVEPVP